jgi:hypothetical protein
MLKGISAAMWASLLLLAAPAAAAEPAMSWSSPVTVAPDTIIDIDCPTTSLCVAVDKSGDVITTTNPTGPATDWTAVDVINSSLHAVSCSSPSLCVAVSTAGQLVTSTDPTGGVAAWTTAKISGVGYLGAVDCGVGVCAALDAEGRILLSSNPTGGAGAWTIMEQIPPFFLSAIDCPSSGLCVGIGSENRNMGGGFFVQENIVFTISDPVGPSRTTKKSYLGPRTFLQSVICPTITFCLAVDKRGEAWTSTEPTGGAPAWTSQFIDYEESLTQVSCPAASFCVAVDGAGQVLTTANPAGGIEEWGITTIPSGLNSVSCPSTALCLVAGLDQVAVGTPAAPKQPEQQPPTSPGPIPPAPKPPLNSSSLFLPPSALRVRDGKVVKMTLTCIGAAPCSGTAKLRRSPVLIGSARFSINAATSKVISLPLNKKGRQLFSKKKQARGQLTISGRSSAGEAIGFTRSVVLKAKQMKHMG